jgi:hypothetical protein
MSLVDFRCALSQISLLGAETALILLENREGKWEPAALPLFGRYEGDGTLSDLSDGPNAELVLRTLTDLYEAGRLHLDFEQMGLPPQQLDHLEMWLSLLACSQVMGAQALSLDGSPLGFSFLSAHLLAEVMDADPEEPSLLSLESLPAHVLPGSLGQLIYAPLRDLPLKLRCKFGLSFLGLLSALQEMERRGRGWSPIDAGIPKDESQPALYLAEALVAFADSPTLVEALEDYAGQAADEVEPGD